MLPRKAHADAAGLKVGDIVIAVHGKPISNVRQLALHMYSYAVGDKAAIDVVAGPRRSSPLPWPVWERSE